MGIAAGGIVLVFTANPYMSGLVGIGIYWGWRWPLKAILGWPSKAILGWIAVYSFWLTAAALVRAAPGGVTRGEEGPIMVGLFVLLLSLVVLVVLFVVGWRMGR